MGHYKVVHLTLFLMYMLLPCLWTRTLPGSLSQDNKEEIRQQQLDPLRNMIENDDCLGGEDTEEDMCSSTTPQIDLQETGLEKTGLDRKLLGLPGWEYITVGMVVVVAAVIGGSVAIVCKRCGGLFGKGSEKDND
ncbi:uncharacterized protein LOC128177347 isoform X1 [Crassostrea angulata]|uniref:uncharacterized protein LOC128177347 isoform X1 n=1 Tax=Magallana angulata TaxID=2784310 RepID=UPI0022B0B06A|nr:uncharacterized protein LOC128177347 isoform X1 [Crassostrea angulata]